MSRDKPPTLHRHSDNNALHDKITIHNKITWQRRLNSVDYVDCDFDYVDCVDYETKFVVDDFRNK